MASTNTTFFNEYLAAWNAHDPAAVARHMADDAIYEDVALVSPMARPVCVDHSARR